MVNETKKCSICGSKWLIEYMSILALFNPGRIETDDLTKAEVKYICQDCRDKAWHKIFS